MKKYLFLAGFLLAIAGAALISWTTKPYTNHYEVYSQMWNVSSVYYNTPTASNLGTQLDTAKGTTIYLSVSAFNPIGSHSSTDTFDYIALPKGQGTVSYTISALRAAVLTPTVLVTPQVSFDGIVWAPVPGVTVATLTPSSLTVASTYNYQFSTKYAPFGRLKCVATDTASLQAWYYFNYNFTLSSN